jgi:hypothetical protein
MGFLSRLFFFLDGAGETLFETERNANAEALPPQRDARLG